MAKETKEEAAPTAPKRSVTKTVDKARVKVQEGVSTATEKLRDVGGDLSQRAKTASGDLRVQAGKAGEYVKDRYGVAREGLDRGYDSARKDLDQLTGDVNAYVRDNPGRSVLIAAGLGFMIGFLLRGERRR